MPLKTVVKVGNISNLSDARYCSGMGVDMLGFSVVEGMPNYLSPQLFQEIRGWISGPKVVAEIYGVQSATDLSEIIRQYEPDYFELSHAEFTANKSRISLPCLVSTTGLEIDRLASENGIAYVILDEKDARSRAKSTQPALLRAKSKEKLWETIQLHSFSGVSLTGSQEVRPGFKEYAELADILELLEE